MLEVTVKMPMYRGGYDVTSGEKTAARHGTVFCHMCQRMRDRDYFRVRVILATREMPKGGERGG